MGVEVVYSLTACFMKSSNVLNSRSLIDLVMSVWESLYRKKQFLAKPRKVRKYVHFGECRLQLISKSGQSDSKIETLSAVKTDIYDVINYIFFCRIIFNIFLLKSLREWKNSSSERDSDCFSEIICTVHIRSATCNRT